MKTFRSYKQVVQRSDAARWLILYKYGGVYIDNGAAPARDATRLHCPVRTGAKRTDIVGRAQDACEGSQSAVHEMERESQCMLAAPPAPSPHLVASPCHMRGRLRAPPPADVECYQSMEPSLRGLDLVTNCELSWPPGKVQAMASGRQVHRTRIPAWGPSIPEPALRLPAGVVKEQPAGLRAPSAANPVPRAGCRSAMQ